jgi:hypothetical protein
MAVVSGPRRHVESTFVAALSIRDLSVNIVDTYAQAKSACREHTNSGQQADSEMNCRGLGLLPLLSLDGKKCT